MKQLRDHHLTRILTVCIILIAGYLLYQNDTTPHEEMTIKGFNIVVLPDTQHYSESYPEILCNQTQWIRDNKDSQNIMFAVQLGDIVEHGAARPLEWQRASDCFGILDTQVPYSIVPGNHDSNHVSENTSGFSMYNSIFPASRFNNESWYRGNYDNNQNSYQIIDADGMSMLFLSLEVEPSDADIKWAQGVLTEHSDSYAILITHKYLPDTGLKRDNHLSFSKDGNTGEATWNKLVSKNCNIKLVLGGHYHENDGENRLESTNSCGDTVHQVTQDYQSRDSGGDGKLRIYNFIPEEKKIKVRTYSPYTDTYETDADSEFELPLN
ncbi:MAG: hypothetical protein RLY57_532 [Candidatus Parcubacteria bacterium]|jgi:predicted phosphodiesterase